MVRPHKAIHYCQPQKLTHVTTDGTHHSSSSIRPIGIFCACEPGLECPYVLYSNLAGGFYRIGQHNLLCRMPSQRFWVVCKVHYSIWYPIWAFLFILYHLFLSLSQRHAFFLIISQNVDFIFCGLHDIFSTW